MTQIDFYILTQTTAIARFHYACRLAEKAMNQGHHIAITLDDEEQALSLSDYLWSFKPESFLPHILQQQEPETKQQEKVERQLTSTDNNNNALQVNQQRQAPIALLWSQDNDHYHDVLINLSQKIPEGFSRYQRAFEIVVQEDHCLQITRSHFQFYRERGYPLKSHNLG